MFSGIAGWLDQLRFSPRLLISGTMSGVALIFVMVLFIAVCLKRNKTIMTLPQLTVCASTALLLLNETLAWFYIPGLYSLTLYKIVFVVDFMSMYLSCLAMYWYLDTYVYLLMHPEVNKRKPWPNGFRLFVLGYSLALLLLHASSMRTGWFYSFEGGTFSGFRPAYRWLALLSILWHVIITIRIIREHKKLGVANTILFLSYLLLPLAAFLSDLFDGLGTGSVVIALVVFAIYIRIDIAQGEKLLEHKALIARKEAEMAETRMELMMSQIQPHFLYNALSSISYLCTKDPEEAQRATNDFSNYLRGNLQFIGSRSPVPFEIELEHVRNYLNIEKRRFPDRLIVETDIRNTDFLIPALTMQTLVENAVKYSVNARYEPTTVRIGTDSTETENLVIIRDDGPGFDVNAPLSSERRHIGLEGAKVRLHEMVGGYPEIRSTIGQGTTIIIHIPKESRT